MKLSQLINLANILGSHSKKLYVGCSFKHGMTEIMCIVCNAKAFEIEIQEDSDEVSELKKGNKYCLDCYAPLQEQFKLTLEDVAEISSVSKD